MDECLEEIKKAFQRKVAEDVMGIEQIDCVACEDGETIMLYGYTANPDVSYVASFPIPVLHWNLI